ncbi:inosamine-phosphate amidinotransferase 1 [Micromonospora sp. Llam0]|uniref:inosamine-phosphate amidinotransferase 1 n=1 Tax=Micromonospora sp. Llam0 TaxID=2485143 RepID=UPI0018F70698|nr:inosamine-phosphate amidinotransferase 1 [Micromonospora sp. Llam0]
MEVVVGNPLNARYPHPDPSTRFAEFPNTPVDRIPTGAFPPGIVEETEEDLAAMIECLEKLDIVVKRPDTWPHDQTITTPLWSTKGFYNYCPRDIFLVVGNQIIETPNVIRGRMLEAYSYRKILVEYLKAGAKWYSAPKPMLLDSLFTAEQEDLVPRNDEPVFDAANVLRFGRDLLYLISATGNDLGAQWLQIALGDDFRVHTCRINYTGSHIDTSVVALRPGLLLCNPEWVTREMLPPIFDKWKIIYSPPMVGADRFDSTYLSRAIGSRWIDMNLFSLKPDLVLVDRDQLPLIKLLEEQGITVVPLKIRHSRMLAGGFHCSTLDTKRKGSMENYFE